MSRVALPRRLLPRRFFPGRRRESARSGPRWARWALIPLGIVVLLIVVAVIDIVMHSDKVQRNVSLAGVSVTGQDEAELRQTLDEMQPVLSELPVELIGPDETITTTAGAAGLTIDVEATIDSALSTGRNGLRSPFSWIGGLFRDRKAPLRMVVDDDVLTEAVSSFATDGGDPVRFELHSGAITVEGGTGGSTVDVAVARDALLRSAAQGDDPIRAELSIIDGPPELTAEEASALAAEANRATANGITVTVAGQNAPIDAESLRAWLEPDVDNRSFIVSTERAVETLSQRLTVGAPGSDATFAVENGVPVIHGGEPDTSCCAADSGVRIATALRASQGSVELSLAETQRPRGRAWAESLGIKELVGEFTTNYPARQPRVVNIKRISELTRGAIIEPGGTFSINEYVGRRTVENGFVPAGSIMNGVFEDSVGGGISQYATTLFNAAFFAGLDFPEYQSHSIYITRYPYGREATVSFPNPDLKITNTTPHSVLLWPEATDTSITVRLFSTKFVTGEQTGQREGKQGAACTRVTTERTRTYVDGRAPVVDSVIALYRPEGVACSGASTVPTTAPPPPPPDTTPEVPPPDPGTTEPTQPPAPPEPTPTTVPVP